MSLRSWRFRRVVSIALLWMLLLVVASIGRAAMWARQAAVPPNDELFVVIRLIGGPWLLFGPPTLLLATWWVARRSHTPAS